MDAVIHYCYENDIESLMQIYKGRKNLLNILGKLEYNVNLRLQLESLCLRLNLLCS